jgi:glycerol-3-phosphate dehydrogenase
MSLISLYEQERPLDEPPWTAQFASRKKLISDLTGEAFFDIVIVGGGIHGACLARLAAFNGLKTALFEMEDYAHSTSSRSSKLAHGGFRYLQMGDIQQVLEGVRCREDFFTIAPHLVTPQKFFLPVYSCAGRVVVGVGMSLYDLNLRKPERRYRWLAAHEVPPIFRTPPIGGYQFFDGVMDDTRLVIEEIIAARQEGAVCLNHARVDSMTHRYDDRVEVGITDRTSDTHLTIHAGVVVNCAGPWAPAVGRVTPLADRVRFSRGSHLLFDTPWPHPAVIMPMAERGRYYFIIPHRFGGTLVGTTEREVATLEADPQPSPEEVREILDRLAHDVPHAGLREDRITGAFAGLRTLPVKPRRSPSSDYEGATSRVSRRHRWEYANGVLTLYGGKYTTAPVVAEEALSQVMKLARLKRPIVPIWGRPLPGAAGRETAEQLLADMSVATEHGRHLAHQAITRFGGLVRHFAHGNDWATPIGVLGLTGEVDFVIQVEQAHTVEDVVRHLAGIAVPVLSEGERAAVTRRLGVAG